jgi:hypothetical protein
VAFTTTEFKNGFVPDEWLQTSAQHVISESRVRNMPGVRGRVIEIEICSRSHCWFPPIENNAVRESPKTNLPVARRRSRRFETFLWGQRLSHVHPFARMYIPRHYVRDRVASSTSAARLCWLPGTTHAISRRLAAGLGHHAGQEHPRSIEQLSSVNLGEAGVGIGPILIISHNDKAPAR